MSNFCFKCRCQNFVKYSFNGYCKKFKKDLCKYEDGMLTRLKECTDSDIKLLKKNKRG